MQQDLGFTWGAVQSFYSLATIARRSGELAHAMSLFQESLRLAWQQHDQRLMLRAIDQLAACVAEQGTTTSAARLFGAAARMRELLATPVDAALAAEHDRALRTTQTTLGNSFAAAWTAGWELPLAALVHEACALNAAAMPADPRALSSATPSGLLTRRERDVLHLLVAGQTDRAIGDELFIGRRTVETHVASILNKLGLGSRTAAAAYAVRIGLV